ncbi:MAG: ribonuclease III [Candidatus Aminicenantes bacterium]|nr:ribonuclease III [Candidatus Aminicenantes bacterium]MDH5743998.1 ribonuclease III [Candidatus Aminicenantes bacterium]
MSDSWVQLERRLGYPFKNKDLIRQALTHRSFAYESQEDDTADNEVLEFLGDSVLGLVVADFLVSAFPDLPEGELSKLKSTAASTSSLSSFAKKVKLDRYIQLGKGEEKSGGRKKKTILAGAFEALIAAIYLDSGLPEARNFLLGHLKPFFKKVNVEKFLVNNYKSALQEHFQKESLPAPVYKTVTTKGPDHRKQFTVEVFLYKKSLAKASGNSKKEAEQKAAQKALKSLLGKKIKVFTSDTFLLRKKHD